MLVARLTKLIQNKKRKHKSESGAPKDKTGNDDDVVLDCENVMNPSFSKRSVWNEYTTEDGRPYYCNTQTQETSWTLPKGAELAKVN